MTEAGAVDVVDHEQVARPLHVLESLIRNDLQAGREAAEHASLPYYIAAGEKLIEAKSQLTHGEFQPWVKRHFRVSLRMAEHYMKLAQQSGGEKRNAFRFSSLKDFIRHTSKPTEPLQDDGHSDAETQAPDDDTRYRDQRVAEVLAIQRQLAMELVSAGYKALAIKFHPDKGVADDSRMTQLNIVRDRLKQFAKDYRPGFQRR